MLFNHSSPSSSSSGSQSSWSMQWPPRGGESAPEGVARPPRGISHPHRRPLVLPLPLSRSVRVHRADGSTKSIRRNAGRASRGKRRKMDSAPPAWKVVTLSVRWRLFGPAAVVGVFSSRGAGSSLRGGVTVFCSMASAVADIEDICDVETGAALRRGVGKSSR